jgi:hypothetical protein
MIAKLSAARWERDWEEGGGGRGLVSPVARVMSHAAEAAAAAAAAPDSSAARRKVGWGVFTVGIAGGAKKCEIGQRGDGTTLCGREREREREREMERVTASPGVGVRRAPTWACGCCGCCGSRLSLRRWSVYMSQRRNISKKSFRSTCTRERDDERERDERKREIRSVTAAQKGRARGRAGPPRLQPSVGCTHLAVAEHVHDLHHAVDVSRQHFLCVGSQEWGGIQDERVACSKR